MASGPQRNDGQEILMIAGALTGLCLLIMGAVADLSLRTAAEIARTEETDRRAQQ